MKLHRFLVVTLALVLHLALAMTPIWGMAEISDWEIVLRGGTFFQAFPKELDNYSKMKSFDKAMTYTDHAHGLDLCVLVALVCLDGVIFYFCFVRRNSTASHSLPPPMALP